MEYFLSALWGLQTGQFDLKANAIILLLEGDGLKAVPRLNSCREPFSWSKQFSDFKLLLWLTAEMIALFNKVYPFLLGRRISDLRGDRYLVIEASAGKLPRV